MATFTTNVDIQLTRGINGSVNGAPIPYRFGSNTSLPSSSIRLFSGTASNQAQVAAVTTFRVTAASNVDIDFTSGLTDVNGQAVSLTKVKQILVSCTAVTTASTTDYLKMGPQNVTNGATLCFGTTTTAGYIEVRDSITILGGTNFAGFTIDGTHKVLRFNNPGTRDLTCSFTVVGI